MSQPTAGAVEINGNAFTSLNWVLDNADSVKGFCFASAEQCSGRVQFNGENIVFNVDLDGVPDAELFNVFINGDVNIVNDTIFSDSKITSTNITASSVRF